uniref:Uncharacterized protein n=1 Tax=Arundo donax TaxID=35708 RepID=A0A0A9BKN8_ARUDO
MTQAKLLIGTNQLFYSVLILPLKFVMTLRIFFRCL